MAALQGPVLIADSSEDRRLFLHRALQSVGYRAASVGSGRSAMRFLRGCRAPLLVMHEDIRYRAEPLPHVLGRSPASPHRPRIVSYAERRRAWPTRDDSPSSPDAHVYWDGDLNPVLLAVERFVGTPQRRPSQRDDILLELTLLDCALAVLGEWT